MRLTPAGAWRRPPPDPCLRAGDVHLWRLALDRSGDRLPALLSTLSADERARADRYRFARDRDRFIVGRGLLRAVLGRYLGAEPHRLRFAYGPAGKPALADPAAGPAIEFNVSHAADLALVAVTRDRRLGVDVEQLRPVPQADRIVADLFSPRDLARFQALPAAERQRAFFVAWTRAEAYLKANGTGLAGSLPFFDAFAPPRADSASWEDHPPGCRWSLLDLDPAPGFAAALAVEGQDWRLTCWHDPDGP